MASSNSVVALAPAMPRNETLSQFLVRTQQITQAAADRAGAIHQTKPDDSYAEILTNLGLISAEDLAAGMGSYLGLARFDAAELPRDFVALPDLNVVFLKKYRLLPLAVDAANTLRIAAADPSNPYVVEAASFLHDGPITYLVATAREVEMGLEQLLRASRADDDTFASDITGDVERLRELASDAPVIKFVDHLIESALRREASDIHLEPTESGLRCRLRVDGILEDLSPAPAAMAPAIVSRIKIMSGLDIAERRMPQDGRMRYRSAGREVDFRVATSPTAGGEASVIRLLDKSQLTFKFSSLGFDPKACGSLDNALAQPHGIFLVTGPTGSGKTTTLYAALTQLNQPERKILTIEDPIEYLIEGVNQTQVEPKIGRTFAHMLRSFLRQDPDVVMVGEIRDRETAEIAIQAALTGHLVLSTLHTNDAASSVTRLLDMGVAGYLIASTLRLVVAQRLVRKLCPACCEPHEVNLSAMPGITHAHSGKPSTFYKAVGCSACGGSGYSGRSVIAETFEVSDAISGLFQKDIDSNRIEQEARKAGMQTMFENGLARAMAGDTSLDEILRVTMRK